MHRLYVNTVSCYIRNEHPWKFVFAGDSVINTFWILREGCIIESDERKEVNSFAFSKNSSLGKVT